MKRLRLCLTLILALSLVGVSAAGAADSRPRILPPDQRVEGLNSAEWSAVWWQAILSIPLPENPAFGAPWTDCFLERLGQVGLGVAFAEPTGTFTCEMPSGVTLFQDILSLACDTPQGDGDNWTELRDCARSYGVFTNLRATIDGQRIPLMRQYLVTSPLFRFTVPDDNILGVPAGSGYGVARGVFLMIAPLGPGQHTMHLHAENPQSDFVYDWDYVITVTP